MLFLNIKSYAGGTRPWNNKSKGFYPQDLNDGLLEVVAIDNLDLAILHAGGSGQSVCQCKRAVITTTKPVPMQVDGEPCLMKPSQITIKMDAEAAAPAKMLVRNKTATCKIIFDSSIFGILLIEHLVCIADAVKDAEIENWAATKIQSSFKQYKSQKTRTKEDGEVVRTRGVRIQKRSRNSNPTDFIAASSANAATAVACPSKAGLGEECATVGS